MKPILYAVALAFATHAASAAFVETFKEKTLPLDKTGVNGWMTLTGSGQATVKLFNRNGRGVMEVDGRGDRRNIYWAIVKHDVTADIDMNALFKPGHAIRMEAKVRISEAPRRVHFQLNTNRTTDYDANLREFDLADTNWHVLTWTRQPGSDLDVKPGDHVAVTFGVTDMGRAVYACEFEYIKAEVVDTATAGPDKGMPLVYRPPIAPLDSFKNAVEVKEDATFDAAYPWVNYGAWSNMSDPEGSQGVEILSATGTQTIILRWDLSAFKGREPDGWGVVALTTDHIEWAPTNQEEFGFLRAVEIKGGDPAWDRKTVTRDSFMQGKPELDVFNGQLIVDAAPAIHRGETTLFRINPAVMARLISGETKGIAIYPQGAVNASFASSQSPNPQYRPRLYFNLKQPSP
ncbi:MAG TPA: hypothetical protein VMU01_05205 [Rhizomicrobium sp.]|nr:hypothetical protein [Rhizomicrobium sp.]